MLLKVPQNISVTRKQKNQNTTTKDKYQQVGDVVMETKQDSSNRNTTEKQDNRAKLTPDMSLGTCTLNEEKQEYQSLDPQDSIQEKL